MNWKSIRLELGRTNDFPRGSASRAYVLRLPLADDGMIDEQALVEQPEQATVRRMWPSEPDLSGHLVRRDTGWAFLAGRNGRAKKMWSQFAAEPICEGGLLTMVENGRALPFRVAKLSDLA